MKRPIVALVVGHKNSSQGAVNEQHGITEYQYNKKLAGNIKPLVIHADVTVIYRDGIRYRDLPTKINMVKPDFVVSLHCNAFNTQVRGTEILYYHKSKKGKELATCIYREFITTLRLPERGLKPRDVEQRGGYLLRYTRAPAVICEPFFIDNNSDLNIGENYSLVAQVYATGIDKYAINIPWYQEQLKEDKEAGEIIDERKVQDEKVAINFTDDDAGVGLPCIGDDHP